MSSAASATGRIPIPEPPRYASASCCWLSQASTNLTGVSQPWATRSMSPVRSARACMARSRVGPRGEARRGEANGEEDASAPCVSRERHDRPRHPRPVVNTSACERGRCPSPRTAPSSWSSMSWITHWRDQGRRSCPGHRGPDMSRASRKTHLDWPAAHGSGERVAAPAKRSVNAPVCLPASGASTATIDQVKRLPRALRRESVAPPRWS
jgi:hypothetical protein